MGSSIARLWRSDGNHVTVTTRSASNRDGLSSIADKVNVGPDWHQAVQGKEVILVSVAPDSPDAYADTYVGTAQKLLPLIQEQHVIYLSSTSVYGDNVTLEVDEETPLNPVNPQAKILAEAEALFLKMPSSCVLRLGEIVGPGRSPIERLKGILPGTGSNPINISPLELILKAIDTAAKLKIQGIYNVCSDDHRTRKEYYEQICRENGLPMPTWDPNKRSIHGGNRIVKSDKFNALR